MFRRHVADSFNAVITRVRPGGAVSCPPAADVPSPRSTRSSAQAISAIRRERDREHREVGGQREEPGTPCFCSRWRTFLSARNARVKLALRGHLRRRDGLVLRQVDRHRDQRVALLDAQRRLPAAVDRDRLGGPVDARADASRAGRDTLPPPCHAVTFMKSGSFDGVARARAGWWPPPCAASPPATSVSATCARCRARRWTWAAPSRSPRSAPARRERGAAVARREPGAVLAADQRAAAPTSEPPMKPPTAPAATAVMKPAIGGLGQQRVGPRNRHPDVGPAPLGGEADRADQRRRRCAPFSDRAAAAGAQRRPPRRAAPRRCRAGSAAWSGPRRRRP